MPCKLLSNKRVIKLRSYVYETQSYRQFLTVCVGQSEVEVLHQVSVSHHHVEHVPPSGLHVTSDQYRLTTGQHHNDLPLRRTRPALLRLVGRIWIRWRGREGEREREKEGERDRERITNL